VSIVVKKRALQNNLSIPYREKMFPEPVISTTLYPLRGISQRGKIKQPYAFISTILYPLRGIRSRRLNTEHQQYPLIIGYISGNLNNTKSKL
jgi:hypothetical protein